MKNPMIEFIVGFSLILSIAPFLVLIVSILEQNTIGMLIGSITSTIIAIMYIDVFVIQRRKNKCLSPG